MDLLAAQIASPLNQSAQNPIPASFIRWSKISPLLIIYRYSLRGLFLLHHPHNGLSTIQYIYPRITTCRILTLCRTHFLPMNLQYIPSHGEREPDRVVGPVVTGMGLATDRVVCHS